MQIDDLIAAIRPDQGARGVMDTAYTSSNPGRN